MWTRMTDWLLRRDRIKWTEQGSLFYPGRATIVFRSDNGQYLYLTRQRNWILTQWTRIWHTEYYHISEEDAAKWLYQIHEFWPYLEQFGLVDQLPKDQQSLTVKEL